MIGLKSPYNCTKKGVTLIEAMLTISIISFMMASTFPGAVTAYKETKKLSEKLNKRMLLASTDAINNEYLFDEDILTNMEYKFRDVDLSNVTIDDIIKLASEKNSAQQEKKITE